MTVAARSFEAASQQTAIQRGTAAISSWGGPYLLALALAAAVGLLGVAAPRLVFAAMGSVLLVLACASAARRAGLVLGLLLLVLCAGLLVPQQLQLLAEAGVLLTAAALLLTRSDRRAVVLASLAALAVVGYWLLLATHPNVPSLSVGLVGARKAAFFFVGLAIGLLWPKGSARDGEALLVRLLLGVGVALLSVHLFWPELQGSFVRDASVYTEEFRGNLRLSGFLAGPFHVSLLGAFLVLWGWHASLSNADRPWVAGLCVAVGAALLLLAQVRTGYLAVAVGIPATLLLRSQGAERRRKQVLGVAVAAALLVALLWSPLAPTEAASSLAGIDRDARVLNRFDSWRAAGAMFGESPLWGWGAGSAGATLGTEFSLAAHVTSHNMALGFLVEGGLAGLALIVVALVLFARAARGALSLAHPAAAAAICLLVFGLSGNVSEALPVSLLLMALIGLRGRDPRLSRPVADG